MIYKRISNAVKAFKEAFKYGGINTIHVSTNINGNLLYNKTILITGGGSGIGLEIAQKCVKEGAHVLIAGRNIKKLSEAIRIIGSERAKYIEWDITDISSYNSRIVECESLFHRDIDILVNCAGVQPFEFFPNVTEKEWERIYNTNSKAVFFLSETFCKRWIEHKVTGKYKKIINIGSQGGFVGASYPYRMSKWDVRGMTEGLGLIMAEHNILINSVAPGVVKTSMQPFALKQGENTFCKQNPLNRVALPEEIAEFVVFMMSDSCNFMVGQTILLDGGFSLR